MNNEIEILQYRIDQLERRNYDLRMALFKCEGNSSLHGMRADKRLIEIDRLKAQIKDLKEALNNLMCWQNGPPLVTYERGWTAAMQRAEALLHSEQGVQVSDTTEAK